MDTQTSIITCPSCHEQTCVHCGKAAHGGSPCSAGADAARIAREEELTRLAVRTCPRCKCDMMKEDGCNRLECPHCKAMMCYMCRKLIPPEIGYDHFWRSEEACPPGQCPLWIPYGINPRTQGNATNGI
jgi:TRIAD3 protein (E3 ubiquitin-protein ligase RNF216)